MSFIGTVQSGLGTGKNYVAIGYYYQHFTMLLGQKPFLGTLNVHLNERDLSDYFVSLESIKPLIIPPFHSETEDHWGIDCYFITIAKKGSDTTPESCLALNFHQPEHPRQIVELVSPVNLRKKLRLVDNQEVILIFKS